MIFLISLAIAILFVLLCGKTLRAHPVPFYLGAAAIAATAAAVTWSGAVLPDIFSTYVWPVFARGGLAGALFVIIMWAGAFPNGSAPLKKLMPIRGQLSIMASILTLGHNAAYGKTYFLRLFSAPASLPPNQLAAAVCSVAMLVIMLPLFVTSFQCVRRKMRPKSWKRLQRFAYGFYGLLACHILLLTAPAALRGNRAYQLTVFVYGAVFLSYLVCRISKALAMKKNRLLKKREAGSRSLVKIQVFETLCCMLFAAAATFIPCSIKAGDAQRKPAALLPGQQAENDIAKASDADRNGAGQEGNTDNENSTGNRDSADNEDGAGNKDNAGHENSPSQGSTGCKNGTYTGSAMGMNANIQVSVTVKDGVITDIVIDSARDDEPYFSDALSVIDTIIDSNSTQVDTVTGATYSSGGIIDAVADALKNAESSAPAH